MKKREEKGPKKQIKTATRKSKESIISPGGGYRTKRIYPDYSNVLEGRTRILSLAFQKRPK